MVHSEGSIDGTIAKLAYPIITFENHVVVNLLQLATAFYRTALSFLYSLSSSSFLKVTLSPLS